MTRRFARLAWTAAACTYVLIVLGGIVRITGSGMGCGDHWPVCNGRLIPRLDDVKTVIEWTHRLVAAIVSILVAAVAGYAWWLRRKGVGSGEWDAPGKASYVALGLLVVQVLLGAVTVKLELPPWTVILHLGTAMLLLATLLAAALGTFTPPSRAGSLGLGLGFATVLLGALVSNMGAATACLGFPLCNGQVLPDGNYLQHLHWAHRLLGYALAGYVAVWAYRTRTRASVLVLGLVLAQVGIAAAMVLLGLPPPWQAAHVAVGTAVWAALVLAPVKTAILKARPLSSRSH